jgi:pimeloyl-ACP methyl ester carboxylesterase
MTVHDRTRLIGRLIRYTSAGRTPAEALRGGPACKNSAVVTDAGWVSEHLLVNGKSIGYRRSTGGTGVPVVHVHGFAISGAYLIPTARALAPRRTNVVPDLPGYGRSERPDRVLDIPALAETLIAVLDALDIEKAALVGNSMGCAVSLEVAHAAPHRVDRLALVSPAGGAQNQPLVRALAQLARDGLRENPRMLPVAVPDYARFGPLNGLRLFHELTHYPSLERLLHTPVPTLVVLGGRDPLMATPERVREVARLSPDHVTVVLIPKAAHAVNFSHPDELAGAIELWLDDALLEGELPDGVRVVIPRGGAAP